MSWSALLATVVMLATIAAASPTAFGQTVDDDAALDWPATIHYTPAQQETMFQVAGAGIDVQMVRIVALEPDVDVQILHKLTLDGDSEIAPIGVMRSSWFALREDGSPRQAGGITIYESGSGLVAIGDGEPTRYLPRSEKTSTWPSSATLSPGDGGRLWQVFSTYPESSYDHTLTVHGAAKLTFYAPPADIIRSVGPQDYDVPPVTSGGNIWTYPTDAEAEVQVETPLYGRVYFSEGAPGSGSAVTPSGAVWGPDDSLVPVGLLEPGAWTFSIPAGHYFQMPAQFVGVETPDALWD